MRSSTPPTPKRVVFRSKLGLPVGLLITGLMFVGMALFLAVLAMPVWARNRDAGWQTFLILVPTFFLPMLAFGVVLIAYVAPYLGLRVTLDADGIEVRRWYSTSSLDWASVRQFWWNADGRYVKGRPTGAAVYMLVGDRKLKLRGEFLHDGWALGSAIETHLAPALIPEAEQALAAGKDVEFGPLTVAPDGLVHKGETVPWAEVAQIELRDGGRVVVLRNDGWSVWFGANMSRVPNLAVLFHVVGQKLLRAEAAAPIPEREPEPAAPPEAWGESAMDAADLGQLGKPLHVCEPTAEARQAFAGAVVCFVIAGLVVPVAIYGAFVGDWFTSPTLPRHVVLIILGFFVALVAGCGFGLLGTAGKGGYAVRVYEGGFAHVRGGQAWLCAWERVAKVWQEVVRSLENGQYTGTSHRYVVERDDGEKVTVSDEVKHAGRFGEELEKRTFDRLLRQAAKAYQAGEPIDFGEVQLTAKGLRAGKKQYPWSRLTGVEVSNGWLYLTSGAGNLFNCAGSDVANLSVLVALMDRLLAKK